MALVRRRLGRAIDWRVDASVKRDLSAHSAEHLSDITRRVESLETRNEQLEATIEKLRASLNSLSVSLTDGQRANTALIERLVADVDKLAGNA
jgi:predicted RNase H-like nuclease (RuvC/YqgF family)